MIELHPEYVAGLFDGEGWFTINRTKRYDSLREHSFQAYAGLQIKMFEIIDALGDIYGGSTREVIRRKETHADGYRWIICGKSLTAFCEEMSDKLVLKRPQCQTILEFQYHVEGQRYGAGHPMPDHEYESREGFYRDIVRQNARGKNLNVPISS